eukprot:scaffold676_cov316-Pavlova_lutheri.AAC.24
MGPGTRRRMDGGPSCRTRGDRFVAQARAEARLRHVLLRAKEGRAPLRDHFLDGSCPFSTGGSEGFPIAGRSISRPVEERVSTRPQRLPLGSAPVAGEDRAISSAVDVASMAFPVSLPSSFRGSGPHASRRSSSSVPRIVPFRSVPVPLRSLLAPRPAEDPPGPVGSKGIGPRTKGWTRSPSPSVPVPIPFCPCPHPLLSLSLSRVERGVPTPRIRESTRRCAAAARKTGANTCRSGSETAWRGTWWEEEDVQEG